MKLGFLILCVLFSAMAVAAPLPHTSVKEIMKVKERAKQEVGMKKVKDGRERLLVAVVLAVRREC